MQTCDYLVVGGGMAADAAVKGIRELDRQGTIGVLGAEYDPPYTRPPLTKKLWQGKPLESIWRNTAAAGAEVVTGCRIETLDSREKLVRDTAGNTYGYGKLLLATGGTPRRFIPGDDIIYYRDLADYRRLRHLTEQGSSFAVIGGGFIGSEIAASLAMNGKEVYLVFPEAAICSRVFPPDVCRFLNDYYQQQGVRIVAGETVTGVERNGSAVVVHAADGDLSVDGVVAGLGIGLNVELAIQAGCTVTNGVEVNEFLQAAQPDIYAAGDIAAYFSPALGKRVRFEHEDNALTMGRQAGRNMAGAGEPYHHLPYFYSDLFDLGYEAVGELDSRLETVTDWQEPYAKGVIYYLDQGKVRGVLLWNVWDKVDEARRLIEAGELIRPEGLKGRITG